MEPCRRRLCVAVFAAAAVAAAEPTALPPPGADGWEPLSFRSVDRHTAYTRLPAGEGVRAEADCSASALVLPLEGVDLESTPVLRWRWRVDRALDIRDERSRAGDDFAARVYLMFRFEPEHASLFERARRSLERRILGSDVPGSALNFVWTSHEEPGGLWTNPFVASSRTIALARGAATAWREEAVDVVASYRRAFGRTPPPLRALGIMTDADNACQHSEARYADFRFTEAG